MTAARSVFDMHDPQAGIHCADAPSLHCASKLKQTACILVNCYIVILLAANGENA